MYISPNKERLSLLDLTNAKIGDWILFCENCKFQIINTAMKSQCPDCLAEPLYITTVDKELIELVENSKEK